MATAAEIIASGPPPGVATLHPIGVPDGFSTTHTDQQAVPFAPGHGQAITTEVPARYYEGDDYLPANLAPAQIRELQRRMVSAGLIPKGAEYRDGYWDDVSRAAYKELLAESNGSGLDAAAQLAQRESTADENRKKYVAPAYLRPDPAAQRQTVRQLMATLVGPDRAQNLGDDELNHLTAVLGQYDRAHFDATVAADRQSFDAAQAGLGGGGATVQDSDPAAALEEYMRTKYMPETVSRQGTIDMTNARTSLLANVLATRQAALS